MFHGISDYKISEIDKNAQPHLDKTEFENIIFWLKNYFSFLKPDEIWNPDKSGILLTFDDGFQNNYKTVLPILKRHNLPGLFFVTTQHIKNPRNWLHFVKNNLENYKIPKKLLTNKIKNDYYDGISEKQIIKMAKDPLITIGSHTITHPILSKTSESDIKNELKESKEYLETLTGNSIEYFSYPFGNYNKIVLDWVSKIGYRAAFGIDKVNNLGNPKFEIPRIGIYNDSKPYLSAKLSGIYKLPIRGII